MEYARTLSERIMLEREETITRLASVRELERDVRTGIALETSKEVQRLREELFKCRRSETQKEREALFLQKQVSITAIILLLFNWRLFLLLLPLVFLYLILPFCYSTITQSLLLLHLRQLQPTTNPFIMSPNPFDQLSEAAAKISNLTLELTEKDHQLKRQGATGLGVSKASANANNANSNALGAGVQGQTRRALPPTPSSSQL